MPIFRQYCQRAAELAGLSAGMEILDVACGPGTLSLMLHPVAARIDAVDFSEGMLKRLGNTIQKEKITNLHPQFMDGQNLTFADNRFDRAFSMFGLIFFPDRIQGFRELFRVLKPGGVAAVSSWAPFEKSPLMQLLYGALKAASPENPENKNPLGLEDPARFQKEMQEAGFSDVKITEFQGFWEITDARKFLDSMIRGSVPIVIMKNELSEPEWQTKYQAMLQYIKNTLPPLPASLHSTAYIGTGVKRQ